MSTLLETIVIDTAPNPTAAVIWMHGLGADGSDFASLLPQIDLRACPPTRFVFPSADTMPVTLSNGYVMRSWYDIAAAGADIDLREDEAGLRKSQGQIEALIARETARGIPAKRIVLAGFSQGCAMTLMTGLRHPQGLAGLMCLSGYLPLAPNTAAERHAANAATPIFMAHGSDDPVVPFLRGQQSRDLLRGFGYPVEWHEYPMQHTLHPQEIIDIGAWLTRVLA